MNGSILEKIIAAKKIRVAEAKRQCDLSELREKAVQYRENRGTNRFAQALGDRSRISIIAEFKRASPSKGIINDGRDPAETTLAYKNGGAAAISVLTEEDFFKGSLADLKAVRKAVDLPILRKDFVIDEFQIYESAGADAVLLIVAALGKDELRRFQSLADSFGLDAIVEVHDLDELEIAGSIGASIIGVNNRNLRTFDVSLNVSRELIKRRPDGALMIAESGISTREEVLELSELGYDGFLIGEALMRSGDPVAELGGLATESTEKKGLADRN